MITYPFPRPSISTADWQKLFSAQCAEAAWPAAARTLSEHGDELPLAFGAYEFAKVVATFAEHAPVICLDLALPFGEPATLRDETLVVLIDAQIAVCRQSLPDHWISAAHALHAAILLRPRVKDSEQRLSACFQEFARATGMMERRYLGFESETADDPRVPSAPLGDVARLCADGYHPSALIWLVSEAFNHALSQEFVLNALRSVFVEAYWPSWRACARLRDDEEETIRTAARQLLSAREIIGGARGHLEAFASWEEFPERSGRPVEDDDVEF